MRKKVKATDVEVVGSKDRLAVASVELPMRETFVCNVECALEEASMMSPPLADQYEYVRHRAHILILSAS